MERITKGKKVEKVRLEDDRLQRLHERTCREFQGENFEDLVDWALEYISDIERRAGGPTGPPTRGDGSSPGQHRKSWSTNVYLIIQNRGVV